MPKNDKDFWICLNNANPRSTF